MKGLPGGGVGTAWFDEALARPQSSITRRWMGLGLSKMFELQQPS